MRPRIEDVAVVVVVTVWTFVGPALIDDGWIMQIASHRNPGGQFRNYHDFWDASLPLGFWHEAVYWIVTSVASEFIFARLVALALVVAGWFVLRLALRPFVPHTARMAWWAAAVLTMTFGLAWTVTLRAEPMVGLMSVVCLGCALRFRSSPDSRWLLVSGIATAIGLTLHPSGLIVAAPLVVIIPDVVRFVRADARRIWNIAAATMVSLSILVLMLFADSDARLWNDNRNTISLGKNVALGWRDEGERYRLLFTSIYDTALRRASVLTAVLVLLLFVLSWSRRRRLASAIPALSLAVAFLLLVATPSKWPWHFGSIGLLAASALAVEIRELARARSVGAGHIVALVGFVFVGAIAWKGQEIWTSFVSGYGRDTFLDVAPIASSPVTWAVVGVLLAVGWRVRGRPWPTSVIHASSILPIIVLGSIIAATEVRFVAASVAEQGSIGRENVNAILGRNRCGLAPVMMIDDPARSSSAPDAVVESDTTVGDLTLPPLGTGVDDALEAGERPSWVNRVVGTHVTGSSDTGWVATPWQVVPPGSQGLFAGVLGSVTDPDGVVLQRGTLVDGRVEVTAENPVTVADPDPRWARIYLGRWDADDDTVARLVLRDRNMDEWFAVSDITTAPTTDLQTIADEGSVILVDPFLRTRLPCIEEPPLDHGVAIEPDLVIGSTPIGTDTAPRFTSDLRTPTTVNATLDGTQLVTVTSFEPRPDWIDTPATSRPG